MSIYDYGVQPRKSPDPKSRTEKPMTATEVLEKMKDRKAYPDKASKEINDDIEKTCGKIFELFINKIMPLLPKPIKVKLIGIDSWNRPVFRDVREDKNEFYGSVDILCDFSDTETDVLEKVMAKDLCYFGNTFGCEPNGDPVEVEIVPNPPKVVKPKREIYRAIVYRRGNDWILSDGEKDNDDPDLDIPYWIAEKEDVKKHMKEALEKSIRVNTDSR